jgi:hypothetical protein
MHKFSMPHWRTLITDTEDLHFLQEVLLMSDKSENGAAGSPRPSRRRRRVVLDSDDEEAADIPNIATSVFDQGDKGGADSTNVTTPELEFRDLIQPQPQSQSSELTAIQTVRNIASNDQVATSTLSMNPMGNNKAFTPLLTVPLLDRSTVPNVLIQIMYGNASFNLARESNIELPECLRLRYALQAVINPKTHAIISKMCGLAVDVCNQVEVYVDGIDRRFEQVFNLMDQSLPAHPVKSHGEMDTASDRHDGRGINDEIGIVSDYQGGTDTKEAPEKLLQVDQLSPTGVRPPNTGTNLKNSVKGLISNDSVTRNGPEPEFNFLWLTDIGVYNYESWLRREQKKLRKAIQTLECFIANHGLEPHQVTAATKRAILLAENDDEEDDAGTLQAEAFPKMSTNDFVVMECADEYGKWYSEQLLEFIYTAVDWTLERYDFATMLEDINTWTIGRTEIWTKTAEYGLQAHDADAELRAVLGEGLVYVIENGLVEGPLIASKFVGGGKGGLQ